MKVSSKILDNIEESLIDDFNQKLRNVKTFEEFEDLEKEVNNTGYGLVFRTRRAKWHAHSFTKADNNRIHYLLGDGVSERVQDIDKLFRFIEVSNTCR